MNEVNREIRKPVEEFARAMEAKLRKNDHKKHWSECGIDYLMYRLRGELMELESAIIGGRNYDDICDECVDVANFAMFVFDNLSKNNTKNEKPLDISV